MEETLTKLKKKAKKKIHYGINSNDIKTSSKKTDLYSTNSILKLRNIMLVT